MEFKLNDYHGNVSDEELKCIFRIALHYTTFLLQRQALKIFIISVTAKQ